MYSFRVSLLNLLHLPLLILCGILIVVGRGRPRSSSLSFTFLHLRLICMCLRIDSKYTYPYNVIILLCGSYIVGSVFLVVREALFSMSPSTCVFLRVLSMYTLSMRRSCNLQFDPVNSFNIHTPDNFVFTSIFFYIDLSDILLIIVLV